VRILVIGRLTRKIPGVMVCKLAGMRLHTRTMIRDGQIGFIGSQSLRAVELDARREVGLIFREPKVVARIRDVFSADWAQAQQAEGRPEEPAPALKVAKRVAKLVAKELPDVAPVLDGAVKEIVGDDAQVELDPDEIKEAVRGAVKTAVRDVVSELVEEVVEEDGSRTV
jgi:cardiolipin synthase A/B